MSLKDRYLAALDFSSYVQSVEKNKRLWHAIYDRAAISPEILDEARMIPGTWHLLVLSADWCGDAVNSIPVLARLAEEVSDFELRVLSVEENPDLMDTHLTNGKSRSIPVVLLLDDDFKEHGWWGPRPRPLQEWVIKEGLSIPSAERYKRVRRYYAKDRGRTMFRELFSLMAPTAQG